MGNFANANVLSLFFRTFFLLLQATKVKTANNMMQKSRLIFHYIIPLEVTLQA